MSIKIIIHNVIKNNDEILLLKRASTVHNLPDFWDIPGGSLENGEDLAEGVIRETLEETGLNPSVPKLFHYFSNYEKSKDMHYITLFFSSNYISGEIKLNPDEHQEYMWVKFTDLERFGTENKTPDYFAGLCQIILDTK